MSKTISLKEVKILSIYVYLNLFQNNYKRFIKICLISLLTNLFEIMIIFDVKNEKTHIEIIKNLLRYEKLRKPFSHTSKNFIYKQRNTIYIVCMKWI